MGEYIYLMWSLMESYEEVVKEICKIYVFGEKGSPL
jgi:hypothetical protein